MNVLIILFAMTGARALGLVHATMSRQFSRTFAHRWRPQPICMGSGVFFLCERNLVDRYIKTIIYCHEPEAFGVLQQDENQQTLFILGKKSSNTHTVLASLTTYKEFSRSVGNFKAWYSSNFPDTALLFKDPYCIAVLKTHDS